MSITCFPLTTSAWGNCLKVNKVST
jgi:hypothetical protein